MSIVAILLPLLESESLSNKKKVWGISISVGETLAGGWFQTSLDMAKQVAINSLSRLRECVRMHVTVGERTGINK